MVSPALTAAVSLTLVSKLHVQHAPWVGRLKLMPVLEGGRVLVTVALAAKVIRTKEEE
jgi:hypothetical protein